MCGDGANDCGALKAAHTGISLSDAESSVASPFTSKNPNITCVPDIIKEGRAALVTSFGIFKYMASYSLCQFISVMILYSIDSNLTDIQYLYIDLFIISIFAFFFGKTEAYSGKLVKETPLSSLISLSPILSLFLQLVLVSIFQTAAFEHVQVQEWFVPYNSSIRGESEHVACWENYTVFAISSFQYVILAIVFSKGPPYRQSIFSNYGFMLSCIGLSAFSAYLILNPIDFLRDQFELVLPPVWDFKLYILGYAIVHFIIATVVEVLIIEHLVFKKLRFKYHNINKSRRKFLAVERDLQKDTKWPMLSSDFKSTASPQSLIETPKYTAEIVIENENTFDKNHVLNSFFDVTKSTEATLSSADSIKLQIKQRQKHISESEVRLDPATLTPLPTAAAKNPNNHTTAFSCDELDSGRSLNRNSKILSESAPNVSTVNCFLQPSTDQFDQPTNIYNQSAILEMNDMDLR